MLRNMTKEEVSLRGADLKKHDRRQNRKLCCFLAHLFARIKMHYALISLILTVLRNLRRASEIFFAKSCLVPNHVD